MTRHVTRRVSRKLQPWSVRPLHHAEQLERRVLLATIPVSGHITSNTTWTSGNVYSMTNMVYVDAGATLTIQPGVVVKGLRGTGWASGLTVSGTLLGQATAGNEIVFTSLRDDQHGGDTNGDGSATAPAPGDWGGIHFNTGSSASIIDHAEMLYAGVNANNSAYIQAISFYGASTPTVRNSVIRSSYAAAMYMDLTANPSLSGNTLEGNAINGLRVQAGTLTSNQSWDDPSVVYVMDNNITVASGVTLTIAPGMVIKGYKGSGWSAGLAVSGTLLAQSSAGNKIVFTSLRDDQQGGDTNGDSSSTAPTPGDWGGIHFSSGSSASVLDRAQVLYAGVNSTNGAYIQAISFLGTSTPTVRNSLVRKSYSSAMYMELTANPALSGNAFDSNGTNGLRVQAGTLTSNQSWDDPDVVYVLDNNITVATGATLSIAPGLIIKGQRGSGWAAGIEVSGKILAQGTAGAEIVFTSLRDDQRGGDTNNDGSASAAAGSDWSGLQFNSTSGDTSVLEHVNVYYAGVNKTNSTVVEAVRLYGASPTISKCEIAYTPSAGIRVDTFAYPQIMGTLLYRNTSGVYATGSSTPEIINCTINGNDIGVNADSSSGVLLRNNIISNHTTGSAKGVNLSGGATATFEYNLFFANTTNVSGATNPIGTNGNKAGNPWFSDTSNNDYSLRVNSAAIDAATSNLAPTTDHLDHPRLDIAAIGNTGGGLYPHFDMGAFEYVGPKVKTALFAYEASHQVVITFDEDVTLSLGIDDLVVTPAGGGSNISPVSVTTDAGLKKGTFNFTTPLADGNYRARLIASGVINNGAQPMYEEYYLDFFVLVGDANHDRIVDITDLGILATNWQGSPRTFSQGDFNYDGIVDISDLGILATNWQKSLPAPALPLAAPLSGIRPTAVAATVGQGAATFRKSSRAIDLIDSPQSPVLN